MLIRLFKMVEVAYGKAPVIWEAIRVKLWENCSVRPRQHIPVFFWLNVYHLVLCFLLLQGKTGNSADSDDTLRLTRVGRRLANNKIGFDQ